jgi:hypothetical protein
MQIDLAMPAHQLSLGAPCAVTPCHRRPVPTLSVLGIKCHSGECVRVAAAVSPDGDVPLAELRQHQKNKAQSG